MALTFSVSERYLTQSIDLTATPQAVLTNSSTYTRASLVADVTAEEVSGSGYSRPTLTVASNQVNADGYGVITYATFSITASGGDITFDRIALLADSDWAGWYDAGSTTITDGSSKTFSLVFAIGESGAILTGADGENAYTLTTADFTQPAASSTVAVSVENSGWLAVGAYVYFFDGTNAGFYIVSAIGGATSITLENLGYTGSATVGTTMGLGGQLVASGVIGATGAQGVSGFGLQFTFSATTTGPAGAGELRFNNASPGSATQIFIDAEDNGAVDVSSITSKLTDGSTVLINDISDISTWALYRLTAVTDNTTDLTLDVIAVGANGTFSGDVLLTFSIREGFTLAPTKTSNYTAQEFERVPCDTSGGGFVITPPASGKFGVIDTVGTSPDTGFGANNLTITPTSGTIMGDASLILDVGAIAPDFELVGTDWRVINTGEQGPVGEQGPTGATGATGPAGPTGATGSVSAASSLVLQEQVAAPSTGANEIQVFNDTNVLQWRLESNGATYTAAALEKSNTWSGAQGVAEVSLTDGANIAVDASLSNAFTVTLAGTPRTLDNPTNQVAGFTYIFRIVSAGNTLNYGTAYKDMTGASLTSLSGSSNAVDFLSCYSDGTNLYCNYGA